MIRTSVVLLALVPALASAQLTFPGGNIAPGTTWGLPGISQTVTLNGDVTIPAGVTLTVLAGTTITAAATDNIMRAGGTSLVDVFVEGTLTVQESAGQTTTFTGPSTGRSTWGGLIVTGGASLQAGSTQFQRMSQGIRVVAGMAPTTVTLNNSTLQNTTGCLSFTGAGTPPTATLSNVTLAGCTNSAVSVSAGTVTMTSSVVRDTTGSDGAIKLTGGTISVDRSTVSYNAYHGVLADCGAGSINVTNSIISHNGSTGLRRYTFCSAP
ncbi:MAG: right-handed parallel beta-helix repeat-containing protein, partial [Myxococcales bacterium]|nr:right-handed parallel beta-helix repeat-containing protein [Myxococcales bacterium]MDP3504714.1 right-handed parallel beta-helix repeat-containing protein [Myxococcales bacterium]